MSDERTAMDQVGRYWDAVARGDGAPDPALDPAMARTIHRVHGLAATPSAAARERVWQSVLASAEAARRQEEGSMLRALMPNGRALDVPGVGIPEGAPSVRQRWYAAPLATAALLLLTLVGSYMIFGPGRGSRQEEPPVFIPAIEATPATPEAGEAPIAEFLWHADGSPDLPFREPNHPVIAPDGNIWVPDGWNNRIAIFSPDGTWLEDWGTEGSGEGEFLFENGGIGFGGVAFDADGSIYVADSGNHRVQKFGPDRAFIAAWGSEGDGEGEFWQPVALTVDGQGRVYVSDRSDSIEVFSGDGQWLASWGGLGAPVGIATDREGDVWVADEGLTQIIEFSPDGERLTTWDDFGSDDGQFNQPSGIDIDGEGRIFVSDREQRVQILTPDGQVLGSWGDFGIEPGQINGPYGVVVGENGIAYVAEDYGLRLQAFRLLPPFGAVVRADAATPTAAAGAVAEVVWETRGGPDLPLSYPGFLALDPEGNLWIPDSGNDRYQIFSPDGEFLEVWGETGSGDGQFEFERDLFHSSSIAFAPDGSFYITDPGNVRVQKYGPDRDFVTAWGEEGSGPGQFDVMNGIAVDAQGRVYVTDDGRSDVQVFAADGAYLRTIGERGFNDGQFMFSMGSAVTIDPAGNVVVSDSSNQRLQTFSPNGEFLSMLAGGPREDELQQPNQVAIDGEGRIFVASPHQRQVQVFAADGTYLGAIGTANPTAWAEGEIPSGNFLVATGVVLDGAGNVYVADYEDYRVQKFRLLPPLGPAAADGVAESATPAASASLAELVWESGGGPGLPLTVPGALALDPDGNLWVTDVSNDRFQIFSPVGEFREAWGQPGEGDGEFAFEVDMYPAGGIAFAQDGAFYVADAGNQRVQQFAPDRSFVATWGGEGPGPGQFSRPSAIAVDGGGRVYVTDDERNDVQVFAADGTFLHAIGERGSGDGQFLFSSGSGIFVDAAGVVWVSDRSNRRIQSFSADGELVSILSEGADGLPLGAPGQPAVDAAGRLFVTIGDMGQMQVFAGDGVYLGALETGAPSAEEFALFGFPGGLALDGQGHVYIADFDRERVARYRFVPPLSPA